MIDVGAGDGLACLRLARAEPDTLAIALDPSVDRLRIGARTALRQKVANVLFVVARIEEAPRELDGAAHEITASYPWGSLLRGIVRAEPEALAPLARMARPGARIEALVSIEDRDAASGLSPADLDDIACRRASFLDAGLTFEAIRAATAAEAGRTTWGKRIGASRASRIVALRRAAI